MGAGRSNIIIRGKAKASMTPVVKWNIGTVNGGKAREAIDPSRF